VIPLYGFLQGDCMGLLILAEPADTVAQLADRMQSAASVRVAPRKNLRVIVAGRAMDPAMTVASTGLGPLDRFEVVADWP
jgi:hypothetical protein